jgi:hypothetical protein
MSRDRKHADQVSADREVEIRLSVAEGHWELGEREQALASLDLAAKAQPESRSLRLFVERIRGEVEEGPFAFYLDALRALLVEASTETVPDASIFAPTASLPAGAEKFDAELVDAEPLAAGSSAPIDAAPDPEPFEAEPLSAEPGSAEPLSARPLSARPLEAEPVRDELAPPCLEPEPMEAEPFEVEPLEAEPLEEDELLLDTEAPTTDPSLRSEFDSAANEPLPSTSTVAELLAEQGHTDKALAVTDDVLRRNPRDERALAMRERLMAGDHRKSPEVARVLERWLANAVRAGRRSPRERRLER